MCPESKVIITTNINLTIIDTPTESHAGRATLLYISHNIAYKPWKDFKIYKTHELESTFIEIINHKKSNIILAVVYQHRTMDVNEFNDHYENY